jgi:hypothetical protein
MSIFPGSRYNREAIPNNVAAAMCSASRGVSKSERRLTVKHRTTYKKQKTAEQRFRQFYSEGSPDECWEWQGGLQKGYGAFWDGEIRTRAHRFSYALHNGESPGDLLVCHACDNRKCVNPNHLFLGTCGDNNRDTRDKGRRYQPNVKGESNGRAKLTQVAAHEIREKFANGRSRASLAREYGVSWTTVDGTIKGRNWT